MVKYLISIVAFVILCLNSHNILADKGYLNADPSNKDNPNLKPKMQPIPSKQVTAFPKVLTLTQLREMGGNGYTKILKKDFHVVETTKFMKSLGHNAEGDAVLIPNTIQRTIVYNSETNSYFELYMATYKYIKPTKDTPVDIEVWYHEPYDINNYYGSK